MIILKSIERYRRYDSELIVYTEPLYYLYSMYRTITTAIEFVPPGLTVCRVSRYYYCPNLFAYGGRRAVVVLID